MVDSSKFADFLEKAPDRLEQIKLSLRRHEKNPNDREFLNDIYKSVHAIKTSALPVGLGRISELCFHLENFLQNIRQNKIELNLEKIDILVASKSRLGKLFLDIETTRKERATVKDLLKRIQQEMAAAPVEAAPEPTVPALEALPPEPAPPLEISTPALEILTPALEILPHEPVFQDEEDVFSLLPDEIKNEEYDRELFQIFIELMQEKISLLRTLSNEYESTANKAKTITLCSDLVGKLQTSANYMGYEKLADYYLQWVAELEMAGVELSIGSPFTFDFMDERIKTITDLFPQVKDTPASAAAVQKAEQELVPLQPVVREKPTEPDETATYKEMFSSMGDGEEDSFNAGAEPLAALAGFEPQDAEFQQQGDMGKNAAAVRKKRIKTPPVELDAAFLEEEQQSAEFDDELFQIFVQQLQENLSQLRTLADSYPTAANKIIIADQCSTLVGKLQSSANYMGYERLAEYYLQWIAELEMAGVELSMGTTVPFAFMDEKMSKIVEVFPQVQNIPAPVYSAIVPEELPTAPPASKKKPAAEETDDSEIFKDLLSSISTENEIFRVDSAPLAALTEDTENEGWQAADLATETNFPEVEDFFGGLDEKSADLPQTSPASLSALDFDEDDLFGQMSLPPATKPRTAIAAKAPVAQDDDFFYGEFGEGEEDTFEIDAEPIAALSGEDPFFDFTEPLSAKAPRMEHSVDIESLFGDDEDELFSLAEKPGPAPVALPPARQELFRKLSDALKSLDDEVPTLEAAIDKSKNRIPRTPPAVTQPTPTSPSAEDDQKLFARLTGALEATVEDDNQGATKPIDQVIEEILANEEVPAQPDLPMTEDVPVRFTTQEIRQKLGLDADRMDNLMHQIGELVANRSSLTQLYNEMSSLHHHLLEMKVLDQKELNPLQDLLFRLGDTTSALGRVSSEIREGILKVRMIPAGQLFTLFQEPTVDLAAKANRQVTLEIKGATTDIDQFTAEDIADCLLHLISNAVEHGIEPAEERQRLGKSTAGTLTLNAYHEQNNVVIEITDDGRGINPKKIKAVALAREMFSGDELYQMTDHDLTRLIMTPGFTTATGATPGSRGPGMDRVKTTMERLGSRVEIKSTVGQGSCIRLLVPLNLPTFHALKFKVGSEIFALPLTCVEEIVRVNAESLIHTGGAELMTFRDENIPVYVLAELVHQESPPPLGERFPVIVVTIDSGLAGLIVDEMIGLDEVATKPLVDYLRRHSGLSDAAIKGDGDISFIPDLTGLMKTAEESARN